MFIIFRNTIGGVAELNISAEIGVTMFAFMWVASAMTDLRMAGADGTRCCCASRRDVKTGRKRGNEKAYSMDGSRGITDGAADSSVHTEPKDAHPARSVKFWKRR